MGKREIRAATVTVSISHDSFRGEVGAGDVQFDGEFPPGCTDILAACLAVRAIAEIATDIAPQFNTVDDFLEAVKSLPIPREI